MVYLGLVLTFSVAAVMSLIAYVLLSRWHSSMKITKKQLLKTLPVAFILSAIPIVIILLFNPQNVNITNLFTYAWELIFFAVWIFISTCRTYFLHFGKKNLGNAYNFRPWSWGR